MRGIAWGDERYVRLPTRNTSEWKSLSFGARSVYVLLMREVDRSGVIQVGRLGLRGVAIAVDAPWEDVRAAIEELAEAGWIVHNPEQGIVGLPDHIAREETSRTDSQRQRDSRERRAASSAPKESTVTPSHEPSRAVTTGHAESRLVTPILSDPIRSYPDGDARGRARPASPRELEYQAAYESGIADGKGGPYAMLDVQRGDLHLAVTKFSGKRRDAALLEWIRNAARGFAEYVGELERGGDEKAATYYSSFSPKGFIKFLNEAAREREEAKAG